MGLPGRKPSAATTVQVRGIPADVGDEFRALGGARDISHPELFLRLWHLRRDVIALIDSHEPIRRERLISLLERHDLTPL